MAARVRIHGRGGLVNHYSSYPERDIPGPDDAEEIGAATTHFPAREPEQGTLTASEELEEN